MPFSSSEMVILFLSLHPSLSLSLIVQKTSGQREREAIGRGKCEPPSFLSLPFPTDEKPPQLLIFFMKKNKKERKNLDEVKKFVRRRRKKKGWALSSYVKPIGRRERHRDVCYLFQIGNRAVSQKQTTCWITKNNKNKKKRNLFLSPFNLTKWLNIQSSKIQSVSSKTAKKTRTLSTLDER